MAQGLVAADEAAGLAERLLATARSLSTALHTHTAQALPMDLHLVRATQRPDPLPDWQPLLSAPAQQHLLDLAWGHHQLLAPQAVDVLLPWLLPRLAR